MDLNKTPIGNIIKDIINKSKETNGAYFYSIEILIIDKQTNNVTSKVVPTKIINIDILSDYENNYTDYILVECMVPLGDYNSVIWPSKDRLEANLTIKSIKDSNTKSTIDNYKLVLTDLENTANKGINKDFASREKENLQSIKTIKFQLIDKTIYLLRPTIIGGIYRNASLINVVTNIYSNINISNVDKKLEVKGIDIVKPDNEKIYDIVEVEQGIKFIDLPIYLQNKYGIYTTNIRHYFSKKYWYIFPRYDITRYNKTTRTVNIVIAPDNSLSNINNTYSDVNANKSILITGGSTFMDSSEIAQLNQGTGSRFVDANVLLTTSKTEGNKTVINRSETNNEFNVVDRKDKTSIAYVSNNKITGNRYNELSKLAAIDLSTASVVWENSIPSILLPGTMVKIIRYVNGVLKIKYGVLLQTHTYISNTSDQLNTTSFRTDTILKLAYK